MDFFYIPLPESEKKYTSFVTNEGQFEFEFVPMRAKNSPPLFLRVLNYVFKDMAFGKLRHLFIYVDDLFCYSGTFEEHLIHLIKILLRLRRTNLALKPPKSFFGYQRVKTLGYIITPEGFLPDPSKLSSIENFLRPTKPKSLRSFIGLCSFYRRWIPAFSDVCRPLHAISGTNMPFVWTEDCQKSFTPPSSHHRSRVGPLQPTCTH